MGLLDPSRQRKLYESSWEFIPPGSPVFGGTHLTRSVQSSVPPQEGPLAGVRVLDMGWSWAGPYAGMILADLGAEVIKLESQERIDVLRWSGAFADKVTHYERGGYYSACNRGKLSASLNLKHPKAPEMVLQLSKICDVVIENFAPRVLPLLGLKAETMVEQNKRLIVLSMSGYGATGPEREFVSYGDHLLHASGIAGLTGKNEDPPTQIGTFYGDPVAGMYGALAILLSLEDRERTGSGQILEFSQLEGLVSLIPDALLRAAMGKEVPRSGGRSEFTVPQGFYQCEGEDAWVSIGVRDDAEWEALAKILRTDGIEVPAAPCLADRQRLAEEIDGAIIVWAITRSPWQVVDELQAIGVPAYPVQSAPRLLWDDHLAERNFFPRVHHPIAGPGPLPGVTFRIAGDGARVRSAAPLLGQHNEYVFLELLGLNPDEYMAAIDDRLIF